MSMSHQPTSSVVIETCTSKLFSNNYVVLREVGSSVSPLFSSPTKGFQESQLIQGDKVVCILNKQPQLGILKYLGRTHFADGEWCGILLGDPCGKNDGSVRGVRYFRCRNKHGIFVHSHKVKRADEAALSKLNLFEGFSSPESSEKQHKTAVDLDSTMASSDVSLVGGNQPVFKNRDARSQRLTRRKYRRNRSISLDRYLFIATKQFSEAGNVFLHNMNKGDSVDLWQKNRINRSVSLPRISKENNYGDSRFHLASDTEPLKIKLLQENSGQISTKDIDPETPESTGLLYTDSLPSADAVNKLNSRNANVLMDTGAGKVVSKVGHAVSVDTHLMTQNRQSAVRKYGTDEVGSTEEDPFVQGRHCSCPSLHCADHFSEAIKTCLELGRTERSAIDEASGENDGNVEPVQITATQFGCEVHSHSHSEALDTLLQKPKISATHAELGRKGSWPFVNSTQKQLLRTFGSSDDINTTEIAHSEDLFNKDLISVLAEVKPIPNDGVKKHLNLERTSSDADINSANEAVVLSHTESGDQLQSISADSNKTESLSSSLTSLSSTGTNSSRGKKISTKKQIHSSVKGSVSRPKPSVVSLPKSTQKQSRLEQIRQQQQNRHGSVPSSVHKSALANKTVVKAENSKSVKPAKRHTLAGITDLKSLVPRSTITKRLTSDGMATITPGSSNEDAKSRLPVKKTAPSQISRPVALAKVEKTSDKATSIQRKNSSAAGSTTVKRNSSVAESDSKSRKQYSVGKVSNVTTPFRTNAGQTPVPGKGPKGVTATGSKSFVPRSSSSTIAKAPPLKDSKFQHSSASTKRVAQPAKKNVKEAPASVRHGASKLPRKVSGQLSNASDSASVTSSIKDQLEDDIHDDEITSPSKAPEKSALNQGIVSDISSRQEDIDVQVSSPFEAPCRMMPPDLLSQTPYLIKQSIGVQVDSDSDSKTMQTLSEKVQHLHDLVKQRTDLCGQLQNQLDKSTMDVVTASVVILAAVSKMQMNQKYSNHLQRKIESMLQEMSVVQEKLAEEESNSVKLQEEMMYQSSEHAVAIETLKADYENLLERTSTELKVKHEGEIALAIETHKIQVKEMHQQHENEVSQVKKSHEEFVASLKEQYRDEIVELESKHSSAFDELVEEHQVEIETIKADYDEQHAEFKEKYEKISSECNNLNKKLEQVKDQNQMDIETRIQAEVKKYESLPAELESIKAVLEMKNEEIRQLRKEKMEKHLELEELEDIKAQTQKLQQENESLSFVVETKSKFERQLSVERDTLRNSLERESAKSKRLSLEKEELQWRLVNSTSPPTTPTGEGRPLSSKSSFRLSASFPDPEVIDE
ncbi:microtubule-associated tumor suppressor 1 homolog isoform X2 [Montipora foliosa]|uniref:microtubule-associated tumor suppressor 1 homolog isoform X2 n=1 Tax=Montipora foliosa TaxID=591990 RepID=UPI0035F15223